MNIVITSETTGKIKRNKTLDTLHYIYRKWNIVMCVTGKYLIIEKPPGVLFFKGPNIGQIVKLRDNLCIAFLNCSNYSLSVQQTHSLPSSYWCTLI